MNSHPPAEFIPTKEKKNDKSSLKRYFTGNSQDAILRIGAGFDTAPISIAISGQCLGKFLCGEFVTLEEYEQIE
uniref:Uncharacterized protein n=1 Tax=Candidatus Kentrum sp. TC TaxID=2126339 RepID=A0A450YK96_9GAMM|nr:MAG: hypothetical protein BECKTC1821E_GA0114239_101538 [Candidatus Kentron sp. TC]